MNSEKYQNFLNLFGEDIEGLKKDLEKLEKYSKVTDEQIESLSSTIIAKGTQHYLIEHVRNAITTQGQKLAIRERIFAIKKAALDYQLKEEAKATADSGVSVQSAIEELIELEKRVNNIPDSSNDKNQMIDDEIDKLLKGIGENDD